MKAPKRSHRNASITDVALHAGVSTASVSRTINSPDMVRPESRRRIEAAIEELGYIPSGAARALATRQSRAIGAIVPTLDNAIFASGISALQRRLAQIGYTLLVAASEYDPDQEVQEAHALLSHGVQGLMLVGEAHAPALYRLLERYRLPFVNCWTYRAASDHPCIGFDNEGAARRLTEYLIDLGHRDIAMIAGVSQGNDRAQARIKGVRAALAAIGSELKAQRLVEQHYGIADGRNGMRELLSRCAQPPTAVIGGNDVLAIGAIFECQSRGLAVPEAISITGFDDLSISAHLQPGLTTVNVPSAEMGTRAADFLVKRIHGETTLPHTEVETTLIVRGTTKSAATRVKP
ncbi:MAG: LacI family DNA-binding transcriptional regulator [Salinisphaera sp.]|nr:LacI family DNA-binding transcriptional regulator [Salinisphaera sp.]